jgi:GTP-binding protein
MIRPILALVGRPNVGKSTLFNRLAGRRLAIVEDVPGVTRDRHYADVLWGRRTFTVVDTGGFDPVRPDPLGERVRDQAQLAVDEAAAVVLVVDGREGPTSVDRAVADLLRRSGKPLFVAVNKMDHERTVAEAPLAEFYELGFGEVHLVSAEHGKGTGELLDAVVEAMNAPEAEEPPEELDGEEVAEEEEEEEKGKGKALREVRIAIVGRPNVGKSTLLNSLIGEDRQVVSDVPGTTRDAIDAEVVRRGRRYILTDTAGIRRKRSIAQQVERYSVMRALRAVDEAEVVACLLDANEAGVEQDARLLGLVVERARALLVVVNKWDVAEKAGATQAWYRSELHKKLPFITFAPMLFVSARSGDRVEKIFPAAAHLAEQYRARIPTPQLNALLEKVQTEHPAPLARGRPVKLYYVTQVGHSPPTFSFQCSRPEAIGEPYRRFLEKRLRQSFGLEVPLRLVFKERPRGRRRPARV